MIPAPVVPAKNISIVMEDWLNGNPQSMIHVAVGVIVNSHCEVLVALRPHHADQGNLWEFPGGKVEPGETVEQALYRELKEEIGITVLSAKFLIKVEHQYPDKKVLLDVWQIEKFEGEPRSQAGQVDLKWVSFTELSKLKFPEANKIIIESLIRRGDPMWSPAFRAGT
jgi:8-oxo-dGTP diphosphatase